MANIKLEDSAYFKDQVKSVQLTGYSTGSNTTLNNTDDILGAFEKIQGQLDSKESLSNKNIANGYAPLDVNIKVPIGNLPITSLLTSTFHDELLVNLNDFNPGNTPLVYLSPEVDIDLTGLAVSGAADGEYRILYNAGLGKISIKSLDSNSSVGNRILTPGGVAFNLDQTRGVLLAYYETLNHWKIILSN